MNGCYSLFSVAVMTAACASARQAPVHAGGSPAPATPSPAKSVATANAPAASRNLALDDPDEKTIRELRQASELFETFIAKAGSDPKYADAVQRSRDRVEDIEREIEFFAEGMRARAKGLVP